MKLSTRSRYGTRLMIDLAQNGNERPVNLTEIARRQGISVKYLEQLIIPLKNAGYVGSVRGPKGGHVLKISPARVTVGDIVRALEGEGVITPCVPEPTRCDRAKTCRTRNIWGAARDAFFAELDAVKLSHAAGETRERGKKPNRKKH